MALQQRKAATGRQVDDLASIIPLPYTLIVVRLHALLYLLCLFLHIPGFFFSLSHSIAL